MQNNIEEDLKLFNKLANDFLKEEKLKPLSNYIKPKDLYDKIDLTLDDNPAIDNDFKKTLHQLILSTPKSSSKYFFNQLFGGRHSKAILGDLLAVLLNNSMATYKISGPQVGVEKEIIKKVCDIIGYNNKPGGTFPTGGSMSNFMSLIIARDNKNKEIINNGFKVSNLSFDTLIAANLLGKRSLGLKNLCLEILGLQMTPIEEIIGKGKEQISFKDVDIEKAINYSCADSDATLRLKEVFKLDLNKIGLQDVMDKIEVPLIPVIVDMQKNGVSINSQILNKFSTELKQEIEELESKAKIIIGNEEINLRSSQQLSDVLINQMKIPEKWFRKTAKKTQRSTDVSNLQSLLTRELDEKPKELINIILKHREQSKLQNTYAEPLPKLVNEKSGRLHPNFNQAGTSTGRLSSNDPNLQNIPVRTENRNQIRKAFESTNGYVLMSADYSQIELRVLAHLSEEPGLLKAFNNNEDIHESKKGG